MEILDQEGTPRRRRRPAPTQQQAEEFGAQEPRKIVVSMNDEPDWMISAGRVSGAAERRGGGKPPVQGKRLEAEAGYAQESRAILDMQKKNAAAAPQTAGTAAKKQPSGTKKAAGKTVKKETVPIVPKKLSKKAKAGMRMLTLAPPRIQQISGYDIIDAWNQSERNLRLALGKLRAEKMKKVFDTENNIIPVEYLKAASVATELTDPMEAEKFLNRFRIELLETIRPLDSFSDDYIFYYGLKLKLILRIRLFDGDMGEKAYRNIYNSIMNGDKLEAI